MPTRSLRGQFVRVLRDLIKSRGTDGAKELQVELLEPRNLLAVTSLSDSGDPLAVTGGPDLSSDDVRYMDEAGNQGAEGSQVEINDEVLNKLVQAAIARWESAGLSETQLAAIRGADYRVADLDGNRLGSAESFLVTIDVDAAGHGWFVDSTPFDDSEFTATAQGTYTASALMGVDMLSIIMHEQGHLLGLDDIYDPGHRTNLMYGLYSAGERRLVEFGQANGAAAGSLEGVHYAEAVLPVFEIFAHNEADNFDGKINDLIIGSGMNNYGNDGNNANPGWPTGEGAPSTWTATSTAYQAEWQSRNLLNFATYGKIGWVAFDLGSVVSNLDELYLWHIRENAGRVATSFNVYVADTPTVGLTHGSTATNASVDYDFSSGGWTQINATALSGVYRGSQVVDLGGVSGRYVAIEMLANGGDTSRVGFAEIAITADYTPPNANDDSFTTDEDTVISEVTEETSLSYDFYDTAGSLEGWTVLNGQAHLRSGDGGGMTAGNATGGYAHDGAHETFLVESPDDLTIGNATLDGSTVLRVTFAGGAGDQDNQGQIYNTPADVIAANGGNSFSTGQKGLAFYNVDTGEYDATIFENNNSGTDTRSFTAAQLISLGVDLNATYRLHYFENDAGGWGWGQINSLEIAHTIYRGLLVNDTQGDADAITVLSFDTTSQHGATVNVLPDGNFTYDPTGVAALQALAAGATLTDTFSYIASDKPAFSFVEISRDGDSGITRSKTYTHAIDFGSSGAATVNSVPFATDFGQLVGGISNLGSRTYGPSTHAGSTPPAVTGNVASLFRDMVFSGPDPGYVELTGLTAGQWYDFRLYDRAWDYDGAVRTYQLQFDVGGNGSVEFTSPTIDQNRAANDPPGLSGNVSWATSYRYQADASGVLRVTIDLAPNWTGTYHLYGLTNEVIAAPPTATVTIEVTGVNDLPNANDDNYATDEDTILTVDLPAVNLALASGATASQSTTTNSGVPSRAIDGNTSGVWGQGSVTHTDNGNYNWWQVELAEQSHIEQIVLFNRSDCCGDRLAQFRVSVFQGDPSNGGVEVFHFNHPGQVTQGGSLTINVESIDPSVYGNFIRVAIDPLSAAGDVGMDGDGRNPAGGTLSLAEVQVFGTAVKGVLANDTDVETPFAPVVSSHDATSQYGATVTVNADGSFTYDPTNAPTLQALAAGETITDTFSYTMTDYPPVVGTANVSNGLVAHWTFDQTGLSSASGSGVIVDSATAESGDASDDGTLFGGATTTATAAFIGSGGLDMTNAADGSYVRIDGSPESDFDFSGVGESMSVQTWMRTAPGFDDAWEALVAKGEGNGWRLHRNNSSATDLNFSAGGASVNSGGTNANDGQWHHIIAVHDAATTTNFIYIDGRLAGTATGAGTLSDRANFMQIGGNPDAANREFDGTMDDTAIWSRAVTAQEIAAINGLGRFSGLNVQDSGINSVLNVVANGGGHVLIGSQTWEYATGLGTQGQIGGSVAGGDAFIVIDNAGNGVRLAANSTDTAWVSVVVTGVNDPPIANDDNYATNEDTILTVDLPAVNLALASGATASQSTTGSGGVPSRAIDGNTSGAWSGSSVTHTDNGNYNWWQVELAEQSHIEQIVLFNRSDCCGDRLAQFRVSVFQGDPSNGGVEVFHFNHPGQVTQGGSLTINVESIDPSVYGNFIRVAIDPLSAAGDVGMDGDGRNPAGGTLSLAEVQVFGTAVKGVLANDTDIDNLFTPVVTNHDAASQYGATVTVNSDGSFTYDPTSAPILQALAEGETLTDSFTYTLSDGLETDTATVTVTITGVNDAPIAIGNAYATNEDAVFSAGNMITDAAASTSTVYNFDSPSGDNGASLSGWTDIKGTSFPGSQVFGGGQAGGRGTSAQAFGTGNQDADHPSLLMRSPVFSLTLGSEIRFQISGGDGASVPTNESDVSDNSRGTGAQGLALRRVSDGQYVLFGRRSGDANSYQQIIWDTATLDAIVAANPGEAFTLDWVDDYSGGWGFAALDDVVVTIPFVVDTDIDINGSAPDDTLSVYAVQGSLLNGSPITVATQLGALVGVNLNGTFSYDPTNSTTLQALAAGETLYDSFTYTISDGQGGTSQASVTIQVDGRNDAPVAIDDFYATDEDTPTGGNVIDDLQIPMVYDFDTSAGDNGADLDGWVDTLGTSYPGINVLNNANNYGGRGTSGLAQGTGNHDQAHNSLIMTSPTFELYAGAEIFFSIAGGQGSSANLPGNISDIPLNSAGTGAQVMGLRRVSDGEYLLLGQRVGNGNAFQQILWDSTILDPIAASNTGELFVLDWIDYYHGGWGFAVVDDVSVTTGYVNDRDPDVNGRSPDDSITVVSAQGTSLGTGPITVQSNLGAEVVIGTDGTFTYDPANSTTLQALAVTQSIQDQFTYTISDGQATDTAIVYVTVNGLNDSPIAVADSYATDEDTLFNSPDSLFDNDIEVDNGDLISLVAYDTLSALGATVTVYSNGTFDYDASSSAYLQTLVAGELVQDTFSYTISDTEGAQHTGIVTIDVAGLNGVEIDLSLNFPLGFAGDPVGSSPDVVSVGLVSNNLEIVVNGHLLRTLVNAEIVNASAPHTIVYLGTTRDDLLTIGDLGSNLFSSLTINTFGGSDVVLFDSNFSLTDSLSVTSVAVNIGNAVTDIVTAGNQQYIAPVTLLNSVTLAGDDVIFSDSVNLGSYTLTLDVSGTGSQALGVISGAGGLVKNGIGELSLHADNTFSGGTVINTGVLDLDDPVNNQVGTVRGTVDVNSAGTLRLSQANSLGWGVNVKVDTLNIHGGLVDNVATGDNGWGITINMTDGELRSNGGATSTTTGQLYSLGGGSSINVLSGTALITGRVNLRESNPTGRLPVDVAAGATLNWEAGITEQGGSWGLTKTGQGVMNLRSNSGGTLNTASGVLQTAEGTLNLGGGFSSDGGWRGDVVIDASATTRVLQSNIVVDGGDFTVNGTLDLNGQTDAIGNISGGGQIINNTSTLGIFLDDLYTTHIFSGDILGGGGFKIRGNVTKSGEQVFSGGNYVFDNLFIGDGTLSLTNNAAVSVTGTTIVGTNRTGNISNIDTGNTVGVLNIDSGSLTSRHIQVGDREANTVTATVNQTGGTVTTTAVGGDNAGIRIGHWPSTNATYNLSGGILDIRAGADLAVAIDGTGTFQQTGGTARANRLVVNARNGGGNGTVELIGGVFEVGAGGIVTAGGPSTLLLGGDGAVIQATADFSLATAASLFGSGPDGITFDTNGFDVNVTAPLSGTGDLNKIGDGTLRLGSALFSYSGNTDIREGTLLVIGEIAHNATSTVSISNGALLSGTGTVRRQVLVDGTLQPGDPATSGGVGVLTLDGNFTLNGAYEFVINGDISNDLLNVTGTVTLGANSTLSVTDTAEPTRGRLITVIDNDSSDAVLGTFLGLAESAVVIDDDGHKYTMTYVGGDGNDVQIFVGEPDTLVSLVNGNLVIEDVYTDTVDELTIEIVDVGGVAYYQISDLNSDLILGTDGFAPSGDIIRPGAHIVQVRVGAVTAGIRFDTTGNTPDVESGDSVTFAGVSPSEFVLAGTLEINSDDIAINRSVTANGVDLTAAGGPVSIADGALINANSQDISISSGADITLGGLSTTGGVELTSTTGSILDNGDTHTDIVASAAILVAQGNVGTVANAIETELGAIEGSANNDFSINNIGDLDIGGVSSVVGIDGGAVALTTDGNLDILESIIGTNVSITTTDSAGSQTVSVQGNVTADNAIVLHAGDNLQLFSGVTIEAATIIINVDFGNSDAGLGGSIRIQGALKGTTTFTGNSDSDVFSILPGGSVSGSLDINGAGSGDLYDLPLGENSGEVFDGPVTIADTGANGTDEVSITAGSLSDAFTLTDSNIARNGTDLINYAGVETLTIRGLAGDDAFLVKSTNGATVTTLLGQEGDDQFHIGDAGLLDGIAGNLFIEGDNHSSGDTLTLDASADGKDTAGTLTESTISGVGMTGVLTYTTIEELSVLLGRGDNTLTISSTSSVTRLDFGLGDDTLAIESNPSAPPVVATVSDPGGSDTLDFSLSNAVYIDLDSTTLQTVTQRGDTLTMLNPFENFVGSPESDTIFVDPLLVPRFIDGNNPIGFGQPDFQGNFASGDTLFVDLRGNSFASAPPAAGQVVVFGDGSNVFSPITYQNIERLLFDNILNLNGLPLGSTSPGFGLVSAAPQNIPFGDASGLVNSDGTNAPSPFGMFEGRGENLDPNDLVDDSGDSAFVVRVQRIVNGEPTNTGVVLRGNTLEDAIEQLSDVSLAEGAYRLVITLGESQVTVDLPMPKEPQAGWTEAELQAIEEAIKDALDEAGVDTSILSLGSAALLLALLFRQTKRANRQNDWDSQVDAFMKHYN
jgi:VCBS repeat-containing protein/autotransporter-associated beta strand protein